MEVDRLLLENLNVIKSRSSYGSMDSRNFTLIGLNEGMLRRLESEGFDVIRTSPENADCIIRVYQKLNYEYNGKTEAFFGAICYIKTNEKWLTVIDGEDVEIDYSKHVIRQKIFKNEYNEINVDFFDSYYKLEKNEPD